MTAEIAIPNKTAVALAADSAVTISAGNDQHKIFDSADKLFELTQSSSIAIMINSDMNFMETPLPVIIKEYRKTAPNFSHVRAAGEHFLRYLDDFARHSPERIKLEALTYLVTPIVEVLSQRARDLWLAEILDDNTGSLKDIYAESNEEISDVAREKLDDELNILSDVIAPLEDASFIGEGPVTLTENERAAIQITVDENLLSASAEQKSRAVTLLNDLLIKGAMSRHSTGIVVAGFGEEELFPTLVSYELQGVIGERLKFVETNHVDIDRNGVKAKVIPFAQREMVERFLYGLDTPLRDRIASFCTSAVTKLSEELVGSLDLSEDDADLLKERAAAAEQAFAAGLQSEGFRAIQLASEAEIEDMVEFMPKPEMARMAEALVNLTSIKRRVSRGFETVGGPIDVAIISKAEGFVWVARKHYFPRELNDRYFDRMRHRP